MEEINKFLENTYGKNLFGQPIFRIVFSADQQEKRLGKFAEHYGKIFLREFTGVREVPKYPWIKDRWVLERWAPGVLAYTPEIIGSEAGTYEPVQVFEHENGSPVPVTRRILTEIIWNLFHPPLPGHGRSLMKTQEEKETEKEIELNRLHLEEVGSALIKDGESII